MIFAHSDLAPTSRRRILVVSLMALPHPEMNFGLIVESPLKRTRRQFRDFQINHHPNPAIQAASGELKRGKWLGKFIGDRADPRRTRGRRSQSAVHGQWTARSGAPRAIRSTGLSR
jgi:hypothetical protein